VEDNPEPPFEPTPLDLAELSMTMDMPSIRPATVQQHLAKGTIPTPEIRIGNTCA
jgi:hypothetical protein